MSTRRSAPKALPHQEEGVRFLRSRKAAALFDEQGLGKSKQLIDAIAGDVESGQLDGALIICPNTLRTTWASEIERHSNHRYAVFGSGRAARRDAFRSLKATFYVINYEAVASEVPALRALLRFKRMALVLDESHRIKSPGARVTRAVLSLRAEAAKRYIMTGTPVANKPEDLWSQLFFLDGGASAGGTFELFRARYKTSRGYVDLEDLRDRLGAVSLRREKEGTISLPPKIVSRVAIELAGAQAQLYDDLRTKLSILVRSMSGVEFTKRADSILARLVHLAQLASNPGLLDQRYSEVPAKFVALDDLVASYLRGTTRKVIIWTSFVPHIPVLRDRYAKYAPVTLHGEMDGAARDAAVAAFTQDLRTRVLVANPAAAREGLTLTSANVAIYLDRTFNLVDFLQSQDRIHRLSQTRPCEIVLLIARNTIDEFIDFTLAQKHRLARYTQGDTLTIDQADLELRKPDVLRALLASNSVR
jgi:SWI/SNF-related matrix-associated actin-dependent regulator of chromatin subfamily A-like protein 1